MPAGCVQWVYSIKSLHNVNAQFIAASNRRARVSREMIAFATEFS